MITYLAFGQNCWGTGHTPDEAIKKARSNGRPIKRQWTVYKIDIGESPDWPHITEMGTLWTPKASVITHIKGENYHYVPSEVTK